MSKNVKVRITFEQIYAAVETTQKECKNRYALAYLDAMPVAATDYGKHGVIVQLMYAMSNMQTWRGENARNSKAVIKQFIKENN